MCFPECNAAVTCRIVGSSQNFATVHHCFCLLPLTLRLSFSLTPAVVASAVGSGFCLVLPLRASLLGGCAPWTADWAAHALPGCCLALNFAWNWLACVVSDPGSAGSADYERLVRESRAAGIALPSGGAAQEPDQFAWSVCRKSGWPKPPHAHFCRVTQQCVLNYDHYCPWCVSGLPRAPLPCLTRLWAQGLQHDRIRELPSLLAHGDAVLRGLPALRGGGGSRRPRRLARQSQPDRRVAAGLRGSGSRGHGCGWPGRGSCVIAGAGLAGVAMLRRRRSGPARGPPRGLTHLAPRHGLNDNEHREDTDAGG